MIWIPVGFAHGFLSLEDDTLLVYKVSNIYSKESEIGIKWDDSSFKIDWKLEEFGIKQLILSDKDGKHEKFNLQNYFFD